MERLEELRLAGVVAPTFGLPEAGDAGEIETCRRLWHRFGLDCWWLLCCGDMWNLIGYQCLDRLRC
eukprot:2580097-Lingulodinium_polyedra.AAC.1